MLKFQLLSDLHLEFHPLFQEQILPNLKSDAQYLILSGDICEARNYEKFSWFFSWCNENYKKTYYCHGNHEAYNSNDFTQLKHSISYRLELKKDIIEQKMIPFVYFDQLRTNHNLDNITFMDDFEVFNNNNFVIMGATTWTNYNGGDPLLMMDADRMMNDKRKTELTASCCYYRHVASIEALKANLEKHKDKKVILVTHHPITTRYLENSKFKGDKFNGAFCSNYDQLILENPQIKHICSGHTHEMWSGKIGDTQYHINPFGYSGEANEKEYKLYTFEI